MKLAVVYVKTVTMGNIAKPTALLTASLVKTKLNAGFVRTGSMETFVKRPVLSDVKPAREKPIAVLALVATMDCHV